MTVTADAWLAVWRCDAAIAGELSGIRATLTHDHECPWELQHGKLQRAAPAVLQQLAAAAPR